MEMGLLDIIVFLGFIGTVVTVGIVMSRNEKSSEDYFLAGRGLSWWLIGFSLIAANISTEQFVGMSGSAAGDVGLAIASYEWMAAVTLVVVGFFFLPYFLRTGIYTIPEFLEYRFNHVARTIMSLFMMIIYVGVTIAAVIYSGAMTVDILFHGQTIVGPLTVSVKSAGWIIGILAAIYVASGGLKACAWADLLQGSALILGGALVVILAFRALGVADPATLGLAPELANSGAIDRFQALNSAKLHMVLPKTNADVPWTALVIGLWIPNFYYWGLNQYITQRTLGARSLSEAQKGIVFAAALKLIIPFIIVIPGIIAFNLYSGEMKEEAAEKANQETLALFDSVRNDPDQARVAFAFDKHFAILYTEQAEAIIAFNSRVAGIDVPTVEPPAAPTIDETLADTNARRRVATNNALLQSIEQTNATRSPGEQVAVQQGLIGYQFDSAFALLIKNLIPRGLRGFMLAAILGAVMSSLASMLNAASTIFTMDLYREYIHPTASQRGLVMVGRICVLVFVSIGCLIAPMLGDPRFGGIFKYIQEFQGFISPGILAVFVFGLLVRRAPPACAIVGLLLNPLIYGVLKFALPDLAFLDRMAVSFFCLLALMGIITALRPLPQPATLPVKATIDLDSSPIAKVFGTLVVIATLMLYIVFW
jgi:SSS family solute:Na+ symporter